MLKDLEERRAKYERNSLESEILIKEFTPFQQKKISRSIAEINL